MPELSTCKNLIVERSFFESKTQDKFQCLLTVASEHVGKSGGLRAKGLYKKTLSDKPLITVITAVYNGEEHLEETILSVLNQNYDNIEYIIIDGGSTDNTLEIINKYQYHIDYWISEPDKGISDAFNKGIIFSTGDYINFQGDGDGFYDSSALLRIVEQINKTKAKLICGRIQRTTPEGTQLYISNSLDGFKKSSLLFRMSLPHQGLFTHIELFKRYGLFDTNNVFCMDYEFLLRLYHDFPTVAITNAVVANWRADGLGNGRTIEIFKEYDFIKRKHKVASNSLLSLIKYWALLKLNLKKYLLKD